MQSSICLNHCKPLTRNGCDCFGCCFFGTSSQNNVDGSRTGIWLGFYDASGNATCTMANLADPNKCHVCKMVDSCAKDCGRCQLCIGKDTIPADCSPPPADMAGKPPADLAGADLAGVVAAIDAVPAVFVPTTSLADSPGCAPCPGGWSCITGCCTRRQADRTEEGYSMKSVARLAMLWFVPRLCLRRRGVIFGFVRRRRAARILGLIRTSTKRSRLVLPVLTRQAVQIFHRRVRSALSAECSRCLVRSIRVFRKQRNAAVGRLGWLFR